MTPAGNGRTSARLIPKAEGEVQLVQAPHGAVVPLKPEPSIQVGPGPLGTAPPQMKVLLGPALHGAGLPQTEAQLGPAPHGV